MDPHATPQKRDIPQIAGFDAALLSLVEIGLGSVLHAFHVPLTGQLLSINQIFILARSSHQARDHREAKKLPWMISSVAALLKSLSPAGKKITPMLAIAAQGSLFSIGTYLFGVNGFGLSIGAVFAAVWAYLQPLLIYWIVFGNALFDSLVFYWNKYVLTLPWGLSSAIPWIFGGLVLVKIALSITAVFLAMRLPETKVKAFQDWVTTRTRVPMKTTGTAAGGAFKDLLQPLFLLSWALTAIFFWYSEAQVATKIWGILRPLAAGYVVFWMLRSRWVRDWILSIPGEPSPLRRALLIALGCIPKTGLIELEGKRPGAN